MKPWPCGLTTRTCAAGVVGISLWLAGLIGMTVPAAQAQLQDSPWPTFGNDKGRTGQSPYLGAQSGEIKWTLWLGNVGSPVIANDGTVYVVSDVFGGSTRIQLHAINSADGTIEWSYPPPTFGQGPSLGPASTPTIGNDGTIYLTTQGAQLLAVNPDGTFKWSRWVNAGSSFNCPSIGDDGTIYVGGSHGFFAINPDGSEKWRYWTGYWWYGASAIAPAATRWGPAGSIHVGNGAFGHHILSPAGALIGPDLGTLDGDPAIGSDGTIATVDQFFNNAWLNYIPREELWWSREAHGPGGQPAPTIASDGTVYIAAGTTTWGNAEFRAYGSTGDLSWSIPLSGDTGGAKPAVGKDGTVYLNTQAGHYALDPADGGIKWKNEFPHTTFGSSPAIGRDGSVVVGGEQWLYAYKGPPQASELSLARAIPDRGGDAWQVTVAVRGAGIAEGATAKLARSGEADIPGGNVKLKADAGGIVLRTTFDLRGKTSGAWDVVVTNPDGGLGNLPGGFTIEPGGSALVWVDIVGRDATRAGREQVFHLVFGNRGNVDGRGYPVIGGLPAGATWRVDLPPPPPPLTLEDLMTVVQVDGETWVHLPTMRIPAGASGAIGLWITAPGTVGSMDLRVLWGAP